MSDEGITNALNEIVERKPKVIFGIAKERQETKEAELLADVHKSQIDTNR